MTRTIIATAVALFAALVPAQAQEWPTRPITLVVPFAAGGSPDLLARILAPRISELLGQQVIVENVGGSGGMIAAARVAKAAPDGYQMVLGHSGTHAGMQTLYRNLPYHAAKSFEPVALVGEFPIILLARKTMPADNLKEFITYAQKNQKTMQYGSAGAGSTTQLTCALLNLTIGVEITHVPYRGGSLVMQDLIAGVIDYNCPLSAISAPQIQEGTVKAIALLRKTRSPLLPDLATADEQGLPGFDATSWHALFLPKGTPATIVRRLNAATVAAMDTPAIRRRLIEIDAGPIAPERRSPDYLRGFVLSEIEKWSGPIKAAGLSVD